MKGKETKDLTVGSPFRLILGFAIPMLLGQLFQQFYNMADSFFVGKLSTEATAAVAVAMTFFGKRFSSFTH